ncbi:DUF1476 domain-containing protein [Emcibacter sp. SYSU 3D8]|uniref:DUF1476 domain-containing protein n=1 Tax=Emcibacter sp. SYSU 3D8 TaxID=3133969 RepID=UPI0031FEC087
MTQFDKREKGFESKYAHDQELQFKVMARRNKLLGMWAAEQLDLKDDAAREYALDVVRSDFEEAGDEDVFRKVRADLDAKQVSVSDHHLRKQMEDLLDVAKQQIQDEVQL